MHFLQKCHTSVTLREIPFSLGLQGTVPGSEYVKGLALSFYSDYILVRGLEAEC
jgi:hypothetical protein